MLDPSSPATGRGLLLFAALMFGLSLFLVIVRQAWRDAALWFAIAVFMGCYGTITMDALPRFHRLLLILGFIGGGVALVLAFLMTLS